MGYVIRYKYQKVKNNLWELFDRNKWNYMYFNSKKDLECFINQDYIKPEDRTDQFYISRRTRNGKPVYKKA